MPPFSMATRVVGNLIAGQDLSAKQFYGVKESTAADDTVVLGTVGARIVGVLGNKPTLGRPCHITVDGVTEAIYGGTVTHGDDLSVDANGAFITNPGSGPITVARAFESGVAGDIRPIQLLPI